MLCHRNQSYIQLYGSYLGTSKRCTAWMGRRFSRYSPTFCCWTDNLCEFNYNWKQALYSLNRVGISQGKFIVHLSLPTTFVHRTTFVANFDFPAAGLRLTLHRAAHDFQAVLHAFLCISMDTQLSAFALRHQTKYPRVYLPSVGELCGTISADAISWRRLRVGPAH